MNSSKDRFERYRARVVGLSLPSRVSVYLLENGAVEVTDLESSQRSIGQGRETMAGLLALADEMGVTLELWPVIDEAIEDGLDADDLIRWYQRLGFGYVPNRDPDEDRETDRFMVRPPRPAPDEVPDADEEDRVRSPRP